MKREAVLLKSRHIDHAKIDVTGVAASRALNISLKYV